MKVLLPEDGGSDEAVDVERIEREQNELMQGNYAVLRNEATALVDVVSKDALHGSEVTGRGFLILRCVCLGL
jgi:nuclear pore complex protein Nup205